MDEATGRLLIRSMAALADGDRSAFDPTYRTLWPLLVRLIAAISGDRILYVDSHFGDIVKFTILNAQGARVLDVTLHDYRAIDGIRVPFAVDYRSPDGTSLANDRLERVKVIRPRS